MKNTKKYYLEMEDGTREYVSEKVFKEYWKLVNRENYLKKLDRTQKLISLNTFDEDSREFSETIDSGIDVEKIVEMAEKIKSLHSAINILNSKEKELIYKLFFEEKSISEVARNSEVSRAAIRKRKNNILKKLKENLKKFEF